MFFRSNEFLKKIEADVKLLSQAKNKVASQVLVDPPRQSDQDSNVAMDVTSNLKRCHLNDEEGDVHKKKTKHDSSMGEKSVEIDGDCELIHTEAATESKMVPIDRQLATSSNKKVEVAKVASDANNNLKRRHLHKEGGDVQKKKSKHDSSNAEKSKKLGDDCEKVPNERQLVAPSNKKLVQRDLCIALKRCDSKEEEGETKKKNNKSNDENSLKNAGEGHLIEKRSKTEKKSKLDEAENASKRGLRSNSNLV